MSTVLSMAGTGTPGALVRRRCRLMGLPTWCVDESGKVVGQPDLGPPLGLWLRSGAIARRVSDTVARAAAQAEPEPVEMFRGCWLIPVPLMERRQRVGLLVAMALGAEALEDEWFAAGCASAQLDVGATRTAARMLARHSLGSVHALAPALRFMVEDGAQREVDAETIDGFTRQLTDGFETIDLLYALARSMSGLTKPAEFARLLCQRLKASMPFGWIGAWFDADAKARAIVGESLIIEGELFDSEQLLCRALQMLAVGAAKDPKSRILHELDGVPLTATGQLLVQPVVRGGRVMGVLMAGDKSGEDPQISSYDIHLLEAAGGYMGAFLENASLYADQQAMFLGTLRAMTASIDAKDRYTRGHSERVAHLSRALARVIGLGEPTAERLHICGLVHDVGKIGVPEAVLGKRGKLTDEEFDAIKKHPRIGFDILRGIPLLEDILPGVLHHHERYDGRGYPTGLAGEEIPLFARIVALADTFDAMSSTRSYRSAMPREKVLAEITRCAGSQFDPGLVPAFVAMDFTEFDVLVARHAADEGILPEGEASPAGPAVPGRTAGNVGPDGAAAKAA
ncbi:MAG: HD domain-containing protein [Phycisphaerae bacterium]|nr:HD domain-containing protein [Phycisphaerae bacterium]